MIYLSAFLCVVLSIPILIWIAKRNNFLDSPTSRKQHDLPVPPLGGVSIFLSFFIFSSVFFPLTWSVYVALALIVVVGIFDDAYEVPAKLKFLIHFVAAFIIVIAGGAQIDSLGNLLGFGDMALGWVSIPFSVACVVYIQNAVNMMDGVDGLAGGNSFIIFGWLLYAAITGHHYLESAQLSTLMACVVGFLIYNMRSPILKRAKIFLGDAGSMSLGLMIAWYAIILSQESDATIRPIAVAWLIALPIVDSFGLLVARLKEGKPPFAPDRRHFHHHFLNAGFTPSQTTRIILTYSFCLGSIGFFGVKMGVPDYILGWGWVGLWIGHTILTIQSEKFIIFLKRFISV